MFARVMLALTGQASASQLAQQLNLTARRIADNRVIAGVHFPIDSPAGFVLAEVMADYLLARCGVVTSMKSKALDGTALSSTADADPADLMTINSGWSGAAAALTVGRAVTIAPSSLMVEMWKRARDELKSHGFV